MQKSIDNIEFNVKVGSVPMQEGFKGLLQKSRYTVYVYIYIRLFFAGQVKFCISC